jgi:uncharacterized protein (TIGR02757 family)
MSVDLELDCWYILSSVCYGLLEMPDLSTRTTYQLHEVLEGLYRRYNRFELIQPDPLQFVYRYSELRDMEIAGFLAASLAYGRVRQIERSVDNLLNRMGSSPFEFVLNFNDTTRKKLAGFKHRFNTADDICELLNILRDVLHKSGSIEARFASYLEPDDENVINALSRFITGLLDRYKKNTGATAPKGLSYLLSDPANGSPCKRLNLFLRWMVRDDDVDAGLWKSVDKSKLIVPVDTHMARLCRILGFYDRTTVSLTTVIEITQKFAQLEPADPVKYDFALSRIGIVEDCNGRYRPKCEDCELLEFCKRRRSF